MEEGIATHSSVLSWRIYGQRSLGDYSPQGHRELDMSEATCSMQGNLISKYVNIRLVIFIFFLFKKLIHFHCVLQKD